MILFLFSSLNRYFCRCLLFWFVLTLGVFLAIVSFFEMAELLRRSMTHPQISFSVIAEMIILKLPSHIDKLLPFVVFFASILGLWRLNHTQEITSARTAGVSVWQIVIGLSSAIVIIGLVHLIFLNPLSAAMTARLNQLEGKVFNNQSHNLAISTTGLWLKEFNKGASSIFHSNSFDFSNNKFQGVTFYDFDDKGNYRGRSDARSASLTEGSWTLNEVIYFDRENVKKTYETLQRPSDLTLGKIQESYASPETISFWKTPQYIEILEKTGLSSLRYRLYWHGQIANLGLMVSMLFLAATFCLHPIRYRNVPALISGGILIGFVIHFMSDVIYALGLAAKIPVFLAAWMPALLTLMLSTTFLIHQESNE